MIFAPLFARPRRASALVTSAFTCLSLSLSPSVRAQEPTPPSSDSVKVFHLKNIAQRDEAVSILTALRNMLNASDRVYLITETNDITLNAPPDQIALAGRLIAELDHPKQTYRLTYTIAESDAGKRIGIQHFSMVVVTGQRIQLKQGDKVPVVTGSYNTDQKAEQTQFTYLDVGMNLDSTIDQFANGLRLRSIVEQSSIAAEHGAGILADEPIVRQSKLEGTSVIVPGKPLNLGGIDVVGSTRHLDIEVVAEPLP